MLNKALMQHVVASHLLPKVHFFPLVNTFLLKNVPRQNLGLTQCSVLVHDPERRVE